MVNTSVNTMLKLGFLVSHGGSSMRAIVAAIRAGDLAAEARLVVSNNGDCAALEFARAEGLAWRHISAMTEDGAKAADLAIAEAMQAADVELVVLSGYLRKLGPETLARYRGRILNIHPGLLPKYGGQGMYGRRVHEAVAAAGESVSGASVHLVDGDYDTGPVIAQRTITVAPTDGAEDIERKVMAAEPGLFVETLAKIARGDLILP